MGSNRGSGRPPAGDTPVRDALLRSAATHFSAYGYAGANTRGMLADAKATAPAMYHHFGSKTGLYVAAATAAQEHVLTAFEVATAGHPDGADRLAALLAAAVELRREHPNVARYLSVIQQDVRRHPELAELSACQSRFDGFWRSLVDSRHAPGAPVALRAVVEGRLSVGGAAIAIDDVSAAASVLATVVRRIGSVA